MGVGANVVPDLRGEYPPRDLSRPAATNDETYVLE